MGFFFFLSFFQKLGVGLPVVYSRSHSESRLSLQLGASCVNQPLFICFILATIHFLLFHSSLKGVQRHICGWGVSYTAANTQTRKRRSRRAGKGKRNTEKRGRRGWCVEEWKRGEGIQETTGMCVVVGGWVA